LNRHIKKENGTLREQSKLDKAIHDNTIIHLGLWYKKNRKLKRKNRSLNRTVINLKYRLLMKKPRMAVTSKKSKRRKLDVLAKVSEKIQYERRIHIFGKLHEDMQSFCSGGMLNLRITLSLTTFLTYFPCFSIRLQIPINDK